MGFNKVVKTITMFVITIVFVVGCNNDKEAKELLQKLLQVIGIPYEMVVNICQDGNENGFCDDFDLHAKITIRKNDTAEAILQKIQLNPDGTYLLENYDPNKKILMELEDTQFGTAKSVTLSFIPTEPTTEIHPDAQELSILQSLIDNGFLLEEEVQDIRLSDNRDLLDQVLLENLFQNQTILEEQNMTQQDATSMNLEYLAEGLRDINISGDFVQKLESCEDNKSCQEVILQDANEQTEINKEEAVYIAETNTTEGTGDQTTSLTDEGGNTYSPDANSSQEGSSSDQEMTSTEETTPVTSSDQNESNTTSTEETTSTLSTTKNVVDGYLIQFAANSTAYASCSNGQTYPSLSTVGAKGTITFNGVELTSDCEITIPSSAIIDSNNNGSFDSGDRTIGFEMKAFADADVISPLTTLLLEKKRLGVDVTAFESMVSTFDPVVSGVALSNQSGAEKIKTQKLMILMEVLKNAMRQSYIVSNIDLSSVVNSSESEDITNYDVSALTTGLHNNIFEKADIMKSLVSLIGDFESSHFDINSFLVNISDAGQNIEESILDSLKVALPADTNPLEFIVKTSSDVSSVSNQLSLLNGRINALNQPTANAGVDQTIAEGREITLSGASSIDFDGTIASYAWEEAGTLLSNSVNFTKSDFSVGQHTLTLTVVDNDGNSDSDGLTLTIVPNQAPIANAGENQLSSENETVTLDASQSSDSDGNLVAYRWAEGSTLLSTNVAFSKSDFSAGLHTVSLTVTDDSGATGYDEVNVTVSAIEHTQKNVSDGYIIHLYSPAQAICADGNSYQSSLTVWEKGKVLFDGVSLAPDCNITVAKNSAVIDSNNNGIFDAQDKQLTFDMEAPANATFISPLTTLLLAKKRNGEDITLFENMIKDFDTVESAENSLKNTGIEKTKVQKLIVLTEILKRAMQESVSIQDIDLSTVISTTSNEDIETFDINPLISSFPENTKADIFTKADTMKNVVSMLGDINDSKISLNSLLVNISDGGKNITASLRESVKSGIALDQNSTINDAVKSSTNASSVITRLNTLNARLNNIPVANAGFDQTVIEQSTVTLDGSNSSDIDDDIISYEWFEGGNLLSTDVSFSKSDFSIGEHNVTLKVTDELGAFSEDNVTVVVNQNQPPVANAGSDITMVQNGTVTLVGSGSDSDGSIVSYEWTKDGAVLANTASFPYTPTVVGNDLLTLMVTDNLGATAVDDVNITVQKNLLPVANAGVDQSVRDGESVTLDGSQSYDTGGSIVSYEWKDGNSVLSNDVNFTKHDFSVGDHNVTLTVTDDLGMSSSDSVMVTVTNILPTLIVNISDYNVTFGTSITFDASGSYDTHGSIISYEWKKDGVVISHEANLTKSDFEVGQYTVTLTVTDNIGDTVSKDYIIEVTPVVHEITLCDGKSAYIHIDYNLGMTINDNLAQGAVFDENNNFVGAVLCGEFANPTSSEDVLNTLKNNAFSSAVNITKQNALDASITAQYEVNNANTKAYAQLKSILTAAGVTDFSNFIDYSTFSSLSNMYIDLYIKFVDVSTVYIILAVSDKGVDNSHNITTLIDGQSITDTGNHTIQTDAFVYEINTTSNSKADILFVMDDSGSMSSEQSAAAQAIVDTFGPAMSSKGIDWKATVIGTEEGRNYLNKYISDPSENNITKLASQLHIGTSGFDEVGLKRAYEYLNNGDITVRDGARLSIVYVSDEVCHTLLSELGVSNINDSYFVQNAIKVNVIIPENLSNDNNLAYQMANLTGGEIANLYNYNTGYDAMMQNVADAAAGGASVITLSHTPIPASVSVSVNGVTLQSGWSYNSSSNSIVFDAASRPNNNDKIIVTYKY